MNGDYRMICRMVATIIVATILISCGQGKVSSAEDLKVENYPVQSVTNMKAAKSNKGNLEMRMQSALMERFEVEGGAYELFTGGFVVYAYNKEGLLETEITSDEAKHTIMDDEKEQWEAYGNVIVKNYIKAERIETDTIYWDREKQLIYNTNSYVKISSPQGVMQGYGFESNEMGSNAVLLKPFDSYSIVSRDSTKTVFVDSANFIGPLYKRYK